MANVGRVFQDKISPEGPGTVKHCTTLDNPPNCVSINKDCTQIVAAGRHVFKVFSIEDDRFVERINLRAVQHPNLNYCTSDVAWKQDEDHILASAATNGAVVLWDLNVNKRSKQHQVLGEHKRTVTRVNFHKFEHHLLISGSVDGYMKIFDLRTDKKVTSSFYGKSEAIRDVQFSPHQYFQFAAAVDSGSVQIWDLRYPNRMERQFTAHNGPCFSIDWHPEDSNWLATAGRDKSIKVWDLQCPSSTPRNLYQVQTIASVAQIKWRPQRKHHIASCAFIVDYSVNVWDVRRPYIPFAAFEDHKDVVTGIVWKPSDPHIFYSSSKDCTLYQHMFKDATRPADKANPVGVDIGSGGAVLLASNEKLLTPGRGNVPNRMSAFFRRGSDRSEQFTKVTSVCTEFDMHQDLSLDWLLYSAKNYKLTGKPPDELCDHNANIAEKVGRHEVAQTWHMLRVLYGSSTPLSNTPTFPTHKQDSKEIDSEKVETDKPAANTDTKAQLESDSKERHVGDVSTGISDDESDAAEGDTDFQKGNLLSAIASGIGNTSHCDFFFGDGSHNPSVYDYDPLDNIPNTQEWALPSEAFQPRLEIDDRPNSPDPLTRTVDSPSSANESEFGSTTPQTVTESTSIRQEILGCPPFQCLPSLQFTDLVCEVLRYYADKGDVQMCATVLIVLGEKIRPHVDTTTQEQWLMSYIDLLGHFELWCLAAEVMKLCNHPRVSIQNQQSTVIHTSCSKCNKALTRGGWLCDRCKGYINTCTICHHPVKGLYVWCQGCAHGGHINHIREWFQNRRQCPAGCGHQCEYSS